MKGNYKSFWCLLTVAFAAFFLFSCFDSPKIFGWEPKSSGMADLLFSEIEDTSSVVTDTVVHVPAAQFPAPVDTAPQTLLFIGDSMLDGLSPRLSAYAKASGHTLYSVIWYSSTSERWGKSKRLSEYIDKIKPTFIFICLGSNELFVTDIAKKRGDFVKEIVSEIDTIPFLWIGPPNWKRDTGINELIKNTVPEGSYFKSDGMHFDRRKDGAHPTAASAILWMDSVVRWMPDHSPHPIKFEMPEKKTDRPARVFIHSPQET